MKVSAIVFVLSMGIFPFTPRLFGQDAPDTKEWGTRFNSPGATLTAQETSRTRVNGQTIVSYTLFGSGLPKDGEYVLWNWMADKPPQPAADALLSDSGKVVSQREDPARHVPEDPINLRVLGGKGELKRFALISIDNQYRAFIDVVPFPLESTSGHCHVSIETTVPDYSVVTLKADGFLPDEHLVIDTKSGEDGGHIASNASHLGTYITILLPLVKGKQAGKARFDITGSACKVGIEFPWGQGAYQMQ